MERGKKKNLYKPNFEDIFHLSLGHVDNPLLIFYTYKFRDAFCPLRFCSHMACELYHKIGQPFLLTEFMGNTEYRLNSFNLIHHCLWWQTTFGLYYIWIFWLVGQSMTWKYFWTLRFAFMSGKESFSIPQYHYYTPLKAFLVKYTNFCISCSS